MQSISSASGWLQWLAVCGAGDMSRPAQSAAVRPGRRSGWPLQCGSELGCCCCSLRTALGWALLTNCCPLLIRHTVTPSLEAFNCDIDIYIVFREGVYLCLFLADSAITI